MHIGKTAFGGIKLVGRTSEVGKHTAEIIHLQFVQDFSEVGKVSMNECDFIRKIFQSCFGGRQGVCVTVEADEARVAREPPGNLVTVSATAGRAVHIGESGADVQPLNAFSKQYGVVGEYSCFHLTDPQKPAGCE